jgi:two-component system response regulator RegA
MTGPTILVIDDDDTLRERLARAFRERGHPTRTAASGREGLDLQEREPSDRVVLDLRMPEESGLEILRALLDRDPGVAVVMLSAYGSIPTAVDAVRLGALDFVVKPADADTVLAAFDRDAGERLAASESQQTPSLARTEWEYIQRVLTECGGNISMAARRLGLHRRTLQRKLQKYPPRA